MSDIKNWSKTAINNSSAPPDGAPEGMAPSTVNDVIRKQMAIHREQWEGAEWFNWGHVPVRQAAKAFIISSTVTDIYTAGRRILVHDGADKVLSVKASSGSGANTLISVTSSAGTSLTTSLDSLAVSIINPAITSIPYSQALLPGLIQTADSTSALIGSSAVLALTPLSLAALTNSSNPGYIKFPGGLILNFGWSTSFSGGTGIVFNYAVAFGTAILGFATSHASATSGATCRANPVGLSSCTLSMDGIAGGSSGGFVAIGY